MNWEITKKIRIITRRRSWTLDIERGFGNAKGVYNIKIGGWMNDRRVIWVNGKVLYNKNKV
jgi:hypothetical protein